MNMTLFSSDKFDWACEYVRLWRKDNTDKVITSVNIEECESGKYR